MPSRILTQSALSLGLFMLCATTTATAQILMRNEDNEVRNAYQEGCTATQRTQGFASCTLPALRSGKRLAIRYVSATCRESNATRNLTIMIVGRIDSVTSASSGPVLIPKRVNATRPFYLLAEPVFLHTDSPPQAIVTWEGDGSLDCIVNTFGYLNDKN